MSLCILYGEGWSQTQVLTARDAHNRSFLQIPTNLPEHNFLKRHFNGQFVLLLTDFLLTKIPKLYILKNLTILPIST